MCVCVCVRACVRACVCVWGGGGMGGGLNVVQSYWCFAGFMEGRLLCFNKD